MYHRQPMIPGSNSWAQSAQGQATPSAVSAQDSMHENSWAQEAAATAAKEKGVDEPQTLSKSMKTDRSKHDEKPMPPTPKEQAEEKGLRITIPKARRDKIVPVTPFYPSHRNSNVSNKEKKRSTTEPIANMPQLDGPNIGIKSIRAKFGGGDNSKGGDDGVARPANTAVVYEPTEPMPTQKTDKAARVLGVYPKPKDQDQSVTDPPASAPATTATYHQSAELEQDGKTSEMSLRRNANSTPVPLRGQPTARFYEENNLKIPTVVIEHAQKVPKMKPAINVGGKSEGIIFGDGKLSPTKLGDYGFRREVQTREVEGFGRVASHAAIVENANDQSSAPHPQEEINRMQSMGEPLTSSSTVTNPYAGMFDAPGEMLSPMKYAPNQYEGIWENDPHVGYSLPPFSPTTGRPFPSTSQNVPSALPVAAANMQGRQGVVDETASNVQIVFRRDPNELAQRRANAPSYGSINSLAPSSVYNSSAESVPMSASQPSAKPAPLFASAPEAIDPDASNARVDNGFGHFVPPPPSTFPGYQPAAGPDLTHFGMTLHHHIETSFDRLCRLVINKHDSLGDELVKRCEHLEEKVYKSSKGISRADMNQLKREFDTMKHDLTVNSVAVNELKQMITVLTDKVTALDRNDGNRQSQNTMVPTGGMGSETETGQQDNNPDTPTRRGIGVSRNRPHNRRQSNQAAPIAPIAPNGPRQGNRGGYHGRRSNAGANFASRRGSDNRYSQSEQFADPSLSEMSMPPDLRDHPAFQQQSHFTYDDGSAPPMHGTQPMVHQGPNGYMYEMPSFGHSSWYDQVNNQNYM